MKWNQNIFIEYLHIIEQGLCLLKNIRYLSSPWIKIQSILKIIYLPGTINIQLTYNFWLILMHFIGICNYYAVRMPCDLYLGQRSANQTLMNSGLGSVNYKLNLPIITATFNYLYLVYLYVLLTSTAHLQHLNLYFCTMSKSNKTYA